MVTSAPQVATGSDYWMGVGIVSPCSISIQLTEGNLRLIFGPSTSLVGPHYACYVQSRASLASVT